MKAWEEEGEPRSPLGMHGPEGLGLSGALLHREGLSLLGTLLPSGAT